MKRIVVCGSREFDDYDVAKVFIKRCLDEEKIDCETIIVSGGSRGADLLGERYARENRFEIERYSAEWKSYGRKAGPIRNRKMAEVCDVVICFWDGKSKGTKSMISCAEKLKKTVYVKMI